ncbi:MAG: tetratricopeptide repeat protein [Flavobacteriales bacterium]|nr:tetratricopeptide repeat protein [Flavobacteriales bacterium]
MRTMKYFTIGLLAMGLTACGGGADDSPGGPQKDPHHMEAAEMASRIHVMEDTLFAKPYFDRQGAGALLDVYKTFAKTYPVDTMAPEFLFRAAGVAKGLSDPQGSLLLYGRIIKDYPNWKRIADAYYMKAFTLDNDLGSKGEAKTAYEEVIQRFPDHRFADDARAMIDNLQYTDEELIERFKKMNENSSGDAL